MKYETVKTRPLQGEVGASTTKQRELLFSYEPVEFEKWPIQIQAFSIITDQFKGVYRIFVNSIKQRMSTCNYTKYDI
jgi:hypothetical protein